MAPSSIKEKRARRKEQSPLTSSSQQQQQQQQKDGSQKQRPSKKASKRARAEAEDEAEERRLTAMLFGGGEEHHPYDSNDDDDMGSEEEDGHDENEQKLQLRQLEESKSALPSDDLFQIDRAGADDESDEENENETDEDESEEEGEEPPSKKSAVWVDDDDVDVSVNLMGTNRLKKLRKSKTETGATGIAGGDFEQRLRQRFEHTTMATARTDWAAIPSAALEGGTSIDDDNDDETSSMHHLLQSSSASLLASSHKHTLPPQILSVVRCQDANRSDPNKAAVQAVQFHPGSDPERPLLLTAGLDKTLRFFLVDGDKNKKIHGIHFPKLPITSASFLGSDTGNVVVSGRRSFYYVYDATAGKLELIPRIVGRKEKSLEKHTVSPDGRTIAFYGNDGYIILVDAKTKHWIADLKMNGSVRAVTFTPDGEHILGSGSDGDVYRWDLASRKCIERFSNQDGTITSSMSASSRYLAVGAESGVVNLYPDRLLTKRQQPRRQPMKSIMNLHTSADLVKYNHDGQILAMSSRREKDGMKLLHVPTSTVFSNWPTSKTPLNYVWSMDFSPESRYLTIGNDKGKCLLYKLLHYND